MIANMPLPLTEDDALRLAVAPEAAWPALAEMAAATRDRRWGKVITFSPKVFLPITNLCANRCTYCAFRRSPHQPGAWTMTPDEIEAAIVAGRQAGCAEALLCLGDKPERAFPSYRDELAQFGHASTVDYLEAAAAIALRHGLLPHTNAGLLDEADMRRLRHVNVSLGLMLETASERLCQPGMPHHRAPDKRPALRISMIEAAGRLATPFTTGILIGIGETRRERVEALLSIRAMHRRYGHIQEVIVQNFRPHEGTRMRDRSAPTIDEVAHAVTMARLILDPEVSVQSPPNLNAEGIAALIGAGINDLGGISPVTPDYINPGYPWPHLARLGESCAGLGFALTPRLAIYDRFVEGGRFVAGELGDAVILATARVAEAARIGRYRGMEPGANRAASRGAVEASR